jgi:hypothetical protein
LFNWNAAQGKFSYEEAKEWWEKWEKMEEKEKLAEIILNSWPELNEFSRREMDRL